MSLNHSKYLRTLPSEVRQVATFHSVSVQDQLNNIREDISVLFDMVEKLIDLHDMEHGIIRDPNTNEILAAPPLTVRP
ncbi:MAG: hypothetical protein WA631_18485 [Nitrososphaeraceae archaeon]